MNIYNLTTNVLFSSISVFIFVTCVVFYIETYRNDKKKKDLVYIESAVASLNLKQNTFKSLMSFHPKSYNIGKGTFYITVENATSHNYVDFKITDINDMDLSGTVRITSFFQTPLNFSVLNEDIDIKIQYKSSKIWTDGDEEMPSLIRLELEHPV